MKFEIDLNEILGDENGVESIQESVRRQVVEKLTSEVKSGIAKKIDIEIAKQINTSMKEKLVEVMPGLIDQLLEHEYIPVDRYGDFQRDKFTTFRKELVKNITEGIVYKAQRSDYDKNALEATWLRVCALVA